MKKLIKLGSGCCWIPFRAGSFELRQGHYLLISLILFLIPPLHSQPETLDSVSFTFQDEKLSTILIELAEAQNLNFSYDANDPVYNTRLNFSTAEKDPQKIIDELLINTGLAYKYIGNQIVLYQVESGSGVVGDEASEVQTDDVPVVIVATTENTLNEVIYKIDTIYMMDTIYRIDTVRVTDTVFIEKEKPKKPPSKVKEIPVDFFQPGIEREKGWALGIYAVPVLSDFSLVKDQKSFSLRSFSLGIDAMKLLRRWNITFGLRLTQFNQRFTRQYSQTEGGVFETDTVDTYYTVTGADTSWFYVTDSSWIPLQTREFYQEGTNTLGYLEFNLAASFDVFQNKKMHVYIKAGGLVSFLIYKNGIAILDDDQANPVDFNDLKFNNINYGLTLGTGFEYKISDKADFYTELYYAGYFNELVPDIALDTQINAVGLKLGFVFYF